MLILRIFGVVGLLLAVALTGCTSETSAFIREYEMEFTHFRISYKGVNVSGGVESEGAEEVRRETLTLLAGAADRQKGLYLRKDVSQSYNESNLVELVASETIQLDFPEEEVGQLHAKSVVVYMDSSNDMFDNAVLTCTMNCSDLHVDYSRHSLEQAVIEYLAVDSTSDGGGGE